MKNTFFILLFAIVLFGCKTEEMVLKTNTLGSVDVPLNAQHHLAKPLQNILDKHAKKGIPGMVVAIKDAQGFWVGTAGYTSITNRYFLNRAQTGLTLTLTFCCRLWPSNTSLKKVTVRC